MIVTHCQRWRDRRGVYRVAGEPICTRHYEIATIAQDRVASAFVCTHHYSGSYVAARLRVGLYRAGALVGVAVFSQPASQAALDAALPLSSANRVELGRFVLLDDVAANGESWFLARAFRLARAAGFDALVSHADPEPRTSRDGRIVVRGHVGTIYQSTNATYLGRTPARTWRLFDDGTVFSARAWSKLRQRECGYRAIVEKLVARGAAPPSGGWSGWARAAVRAVTRSFRHPGTHRYVWALDKSCRARLPAARPYPKFDLQRSLPLQF
jgi:hypothetical protein